MSQSNLISGIQPTGRLHLGNYLGALKNFVELQNSGKYSCRFFVADLHSLTENPEPDALRQNIMSLTSDFLAAGLDPDKSIIFLQSHVSAHSELEWIFKTMVPVGDLFRMTQFKDKVRALAERMAKGKSKSAVPNTAQAEDETNAGLFEYPILMAADILLYDAAFVPVGADQLQHLELTRTIARQFNTKFGRTFVEPKPILTEVPRLMSLDDPMKKMSKSQPEGCLFIDDPEAIIKDKIKRAVTDSDPKGLIKYHEKNKPAISNMLSVYSALSGESVKKLEGKFNGVRYSDFKMALADLVINYFADFRAKKEELISKPKHLIEVLRDGSAQAAKIASAKMEEVKNKVGIATNLL